MRIGAIEAGGTKFVCAVGDESGNLERTTTILTRSPEQTLEQLEGFFQKEGIEALGVGSFGPIDMRENSETYGWIMNTPKERWRRYPFIDSLREMFQVPIYFDTDVNAAALAEHKWGAAKGTENCLYLTVGTGIGGGALILYDTLKGLTHPEMGHLLIRKHPEDDFKGICPHHGDCLEGLASGPAIAKRVGINGKDIPEHHAVWEYVSYYLAQALVHYILTLSPEKIIMGGGVMYRTFLFPKIHEKVHELMGNYMDVPQLKKDGIQNYIAPPALGKEAGVKGALLLAVRGLNN